MRADPLHAEPDHGRGMAARLASGDASPPKRADETVLVVGARPGGAGSGARAGPARLRGDARRGRARLRRPRDPRSRGCRASPPGRACATGGSGRSTKMPNVEIFRGSRLTAADALETGAAHVVVATGAAGAATARASRCGGRLHGAGDWRDAHARRFPGRSAWLAGAPRRPSRAFRRRPLLHGRPHRRAAGDGRSQGHPPDASGRGVTLDPQHARAYTHSDAAHGARRRHPARRASSPAGPSTDRQRLRLHRPQSPRSRSEALVLVTSREPINALADELHAHAASLGRCWP